MSGSKVFDLKGVAGAVIESFEVHQCESGNCQLRLRLADSGVGAGFVVLTFGDSFNVNGYVGDSLSSDISFSF